MKKLLKLGCGAVVVVVIIVLAISLGGGGGDSTPSTVSEVGPTRTPKPTGTPYPVMYFCGYDRCTNSGAYGELILATGINVWEGPDPNRGGIHHKASNGDRVQIMETKVLGSYVGETWYRLKGGGWTNRLWLTDKPCDANSAKNEHKLDC